MSQSVQHWITIGAGMLREAGIDGAQRDARVLMAACLDVDPGRVTLHLHDTLDATAEAVFMANIRSRMDRKPVSHILGYRDFYGRRFVVTPDVLDPRPETETLIAAALEVPFGQVLDLGTGSGAILVTLLAERDAATGVGCDLSQAALRVAGRNAAAMGVDGRCALIQSNWFDAIDGKFDLIVANPPYIAADEMPNLSPEVLNEPRLALTDEADGLSAYRLICAGAIAHLCPGGELMVEIGWQQGPKVAALFEQAGLADVQILRDMNGHDRVIRGKNA